MSRTKIVVTIGPVTNNRSSILGLAEAGMDVARLNGSHSDLEWHRKTIALLREIVPDVPILMDIPGRKVRIAKLDHEPSVDAGDTVILTSDTTFNGSQKIPVSYDQLHQDLFVGASIFVDDGTLRLTVTRIHDRDIWCRVENAGKLRSKKGINVPSTIFRTPEMSGRDREVLAFAREHRVDYVGLSFVESAAQVEAIRESTGPGWPRIVSKIENQNGLEKAEEIIRASDATMIDRGDLAVETSIETVALSQKRIIQTALTAGRPVIVATEMLHSMIQNPFPSKAEISDISNAVLDGCTATMLSGETAIGRFPIEAVATMRLIAAAASNHLGDERMSDGVLEGAEAVPHAMADVIASMCLSLPITKVVAITISGFAARTLASRHLRQPILAISNDRMAARSFNLLHGTEGVFVDIPFCKTSTDHIATCLEFAWREKKLVEQDLILVTAVGYPRSGNRMNLLQTHYMEDLIKTLGWRE